MVGSSGDGPRVVHVTTGKIVDMGITDSNDMGAAMAPAAVDTITAHFTETGLPHDYYDLVVTGDLGSHGKNLCSQMLEGNGIGIKTCYDDCGTMIFDESQKTDCGGSGCACSATVFAGYLLEKLSKREINRILLVSTGALHSPISVQQGDSILSIAHAVGIEMPVN